MLGKNLQSAASNGGMVSSSPSGGGNFGQGVNQHSQKDKFLNEKNEDGTRKSFDSHLADRKKAGTDKGLDYMANMEARQNQMAAFQKDAENMSNQNLMQSPAFQKAMEEKMNARWANGDAGVSYNPDTGKSTAKKESEAGKKVAEGVAANQARKMGNG
jgi:hypothetical protein